MTEESLNTAIYKHCLIKLLCIFSASALVHDRHYNYFYAIDKQAKIQFSYYMM